MDYFEASSDDLLRAAREQGLEGIVGKQLDSHYEPGKRSGAWVGTCVRGARGAASRQ